MLSGLTVIFLLFGLHGCTRPLFETELAGFDAGKRTLKLTYRLENTSLSDGTKGFRFDSLTLHSIGNISNRRTTRKALLHKDFSLYQSETTRVINDEVTHVRSTVQGDQITIETSHGQQAPQTQVVTRNGPVYVELISLMYAGDLTEPGKERTYPILLESAGQIVPVTVRYLGPETLYEDGTAYSVLHYELQAVTAPTEFDQYYLDPESKEILKIQFGQIKFIPESWVK